MTRVHNSPGPVAAKKVVVVDDSLTIRRWLSSVITQDERLQIVGMAGSAQEAREVIKLTQPDVLTLDIQMPGIDGLEFLTHLMRLHPMPVVMLASELWGNDPVAQRALQIGAVACISKPRFPTRESISALCDSIYTAATGKVAAPAKEKGRETPFADDILLVGASTGGVAAIEVLLSNLDGTDAPPIVIAQHMPQQYLNSFAQRLDRMRTHDVKLSSDGAQLAPGMVRIAPSQNLQTCVAWHNGSWHVQEVERKHDQTFCPSIDVLFASAVPWAPRVGAVLLTGLGSDGAKGMLALRNKGARTVGQSKKSCVVYGMPGVALSLNASEEEAPIENIGRRILSLMMQNKKRVAMS